MTTNSVVVRESEEMRAEMIQRSFPCETKAINVDSRSVDVVMSTAEIDRYDEIVAQDFDIRFFVANPVCLWSHDSRELPIGRVENVRMERGALCGTIFFASEKANPRAEQCFQLFKERVLNAVSIGFLSASQRMETVNGREVMVLEKNELVELSATSVGANRSALAKMRARALAATHQPHAADVVVQENTMSTSPEKTEEKALDALKAEHTKALDTERAKAAEAAARFDVEAKAHDATKVALATATKARDEFEAAAKAATDSLNKATDALTERDVDALIGVKISNAQKAEFLDLARANRKSFDAITKSLPDMKLLGRVVGEDPSPAKSATLAATASDELAAAIEAAEAADAAA